MSRTDRDRTGPAPHAVTRQEPAGSQDGPHRQGPGAGHPVRGRAHPVAHQLRVSAEGQPLLVRGRPADHVPRGLPVSVRRARGGGMLRDAAGCCGCGLAPHLLNFTSITVGAVRGADAPNPAGVLSGTGNPSGSAGFSPKQQRKCRKHEAVIPLGEFHRGVLHRHWAFLERTFIKLS